VRSPNAPFKALIGNRAMQNLGCEEEIKKPVLNQNWLKEFIPSCYPSFTGRKLIYVV
jgi:hypothetical protein